MNTFIDKLSYFAFIFFILHEALFANFYSQFNTPLYYATEIIIFLILFIYDSNLRSIALSKPCLIWLLLIIYHLINCKLHNVPLEKGVMSMAGSLVTKYFLLCITASTIIKDEEKAIKCILTGFFMYMLLSLNVVQINADFGNRLRGDFMHPNKLAQCVGFGLFFLAYAKYLFDVSFFKIGLYSVLPLITILGCGSRNGFMLFLFFTCALYMSHYLKEDGIQLDKIVRISVGLCILFVVFYYVFHNTNVGERMLNTTEQEKSQVFTSGTFLDIFGDRGIYYYLSYLNIKENPFTGIGLYNFMYYNDFPVTIHSEFLIHFCEGGLIGGIIYILFLRGVFKGIIQNYKYYPNEKNMIVIISFFAYIIVCLSARGIYYEHFYALLGLFVAKCHESQTEDVCSENHLNS